MKAFRTTLLLLTCGGAILLAAGTNTEYQTRKSGKAPAEMNYLQIPFKTIEGKETNLDAYKGDVVMIVNVASKCGHTPQYKGLEALYEKYKDKGFVILGFPANNFANQEPGTNAEILKFCTSTYDVTFPMMSKISVLGDDQNPLFTYLTMKSPLPGPIKWNFSKFLLDRQGRLVARFPTEVEPTDTTLIAKVEEELK